MADERTRRLNQAIVEIWDEFHHEVNVRIQVLLHLLDLTHFFFQHAVSGPPPGAVPPPSYPPLRRFLTFIGEPWPDHCAPNGLMETAIGKWWVVEVYDLWENRYRSELQDAMVDQGIEDAIRSESDALGDLRLIRNDLLHGGIATEDGAASCEVLRWFKEGDAIRIRLDQVFDFVNQIVTQLDRPGRARDGRLSCWSPIDPKTPTADPPRLVSVRPMYEPGLPSPFHFGLSAVFADAVSGVFHFGVSRSKAEQYAAAWPKMRIDPWGDLELPGIAIIATASKLYEAATSQRRIEGPGVPGPAFRFRRSKSERLFHEIRCRLSRAGDSRRRPKDLRLVEKAEADLRERTRRKQGLNKFGIHELETDSDLLGRFRRALGLDPPEDPEGDPEPV